MIREGSWEVGKGGESRAGAGANRLLKMRDCLSQEGIITAEILDILTETCLAVRFSGKVTGQEYQQFLDALAVRFKGNEEVNLVCELVGFEFYGDFKSAKRILHLVLEPTNANRGRPL